MKYLKSFSGECVKVLSHSNLKLICAQIVTLKLRSIRIGY